MTTPTPGQPLSDADVSLLPCPFCGGEAEIEQFGNTRRSTIYCCQECGCKLETGEEFYHGRAWNRRPHAPDGVEGGETLTFDGDDMVAAADALTPWMKNYPPSTRRERCVEAANAVLASFCGRHRPALTPPAEPVSRPAGEGETTQHTPRCWGRTSYSDEMAHCYCKPAGEGEREAVAREIYDYLNERFPDGALPGGVQLFADPGDHTDASMKHEAGCDELAGRILPLLRPAAPDADMDWQSVAMWMGFAASVIKSGESWSEQCQQHYDEACAAFDRLAALQPGGER